MASNKKQRRFVNALPHKQHRRYVNALSHERHRRYSNGFLTNSSAADNLDSRMDSRTPYCGKRCTPQMTASIPHRSAKHTVATLPKMSMGRGFALDFLVLIFFVFKLYLERPNQRLHQTRRYSSTATTVYKYTRLYDCNAVVLLLSPEKHPLSKVKMIRQKNHGCTATRNDQLRKNILRD